jgi:pantoate--beta-alanine ligase
MIEILHTIPACRARIREARSKRQSIGLVPTMGALHEGHLSLVRQSVEEEGLTVVSIFINPIQFGPKDDFKAYPRDLDADVRLLETIPGGPVLVFAPSDEEMYPPRMGAIHESPLQTYVVPGNLATHLCGPFRTGHFRGVCTVVLKLFSIVQPNNAYFGKKDYQQWRIIERMADDLNLPVDVVGLPTVREADGLAMSSRNKYLSTEERNKAVCLYRALLAGKEIIGGGERNAGRIEEAMRRAIVEGVSVDYLSVVDARTLQPLEMLHGAGATGATLRSGASLSPLLAGAVRIGRTRLIDNLEVIR